MRDKDEAVQKKAFLIVAKVLTNHGVKGQVKVLPQTDYPERLEEIKRMFCRLEDGSVLELHPEYVHVRSAEMILVKFKEFDSPESVAILRNRFLEIPREEARPLEPGHYYYADLVGLSAVLVDGTVIGRVMDVYEAGNALISIRTPEGKDVFIPWVDAFVKEIDLKEGVVRIEPIPGLLDLP